MAQRKTTLIVRLLLEAENKLLFLQKTYENGGGYSLIGGKVEGKETACDAIIRESMEEANLKLKKKHLRLVHLHQDKKRREIVMLYTAKKWTKKIVALETKKFDNVVWVSKEAIPIYLSEITRHLVHQYLNHIFFSEEGDVLPMTQNALSQDAERKRFVYKKEK